MSGASAAHRKRVARSVRLSVLLRKGRGAGGRRIESWSRSGPGVGRHWLLFTFAVPCTAVGVQRLVVWGYAITRPVEGARSGHRWWR